MKETNADTAIMAELPDGWFSAYDLPVHIRRPQYRCQRLEKLGLIRSRVVGPISDLRREYSKALNPDKLARG